MTDLRHRRCNPRIEAALLAGSRGTAEDLDDPIPDEGVAPFGLLGEYPDAEIEEALADESVDDVGMTPWGNLGPRLKWEPTP
jgi:hypothetical protein